MIAGFLAWWAARLAELLPQRPRRRDGIVAACESNGQVTTYLRRDGKEQPVGPGAAARMAGRWPAVLRPPAGAVLEKRHTVPAAPRRELDNLLAHELGRITPFQASALYWRWEARPRPGDRNRLDVALTMVPRVTVATALADLADKGLHPAFIEAGSSLLPLRQRDDADRAFLRRALAWAAGGLAVTAITLPFVLQSVATYRTEAAINTLQPAIREVETLRRDIAAGGAERDVLAREMTRTGDVLDVLGTVTRILPDDTYLTDFALRERRLTIAGRSASAARLISGLTAATDIRDAAFAAPVTRIEGATLDVFSISARIGP